MPASSHTQPDKTLRITQGIGVGMGEVQYKNQHELNLAIAQFILDKDAKGETYTQEDIAFINQFEGSGGQGKHGATGTGVLYEFYTPAYICEIMWKLAKHHGYDGGNVLEPSCATGRLFADAPDKTKCVGFEINYISGRIAEINHPGVIVYKGKPGKYIGYFETAFMEPKQSGDEIVYRSRLKKETTWLKQYPFSLVIGNPPYGKYQGFYSPQFKDFKTPQIEQLFMLGGLKLLKPGGLLVYLTSSNFMRNGKTYNTAKEQISKIGQLVDAYRLPPVFRFSEVPIDILIFKRK